MLEAIVGWPGAQFIRTSSTAYIFVSAAHILAIGMVIGTIVVLDLRITRVLGHWPLRETGPLLSRAAMFGLAGAIATGFWLFSVRPGIYLANPAFGIKLLLLALAIANALVIHFRSDWRTAIATGQISVALRLQAAVSLLLWLSIVLAGRWIGFI